MRRYALAHEAEYGRFPKILIFAVNDLPHTSHADQLVDIARDVFGQGESFVQKITGRVDRPLQRIREFRNRRSPGGRRHGGHALDRRGHPGPGVHRLPPAGEVPHPLRADAGPGHAQGGAVSRQVPLQVFDCFDGTLLEYFRKATGITAEMPAQPSRTIAEIIEDIWQNRDRDYNTRCLVKRLQRIDKEMSGEAREMFAAFIPHGDLASIRGGASPTPRAKTSRRRWSSSATRPSRTFWRTTLAGRSRSSSRTRPKTSSPACRWSAAPTGPNTSQRTTWPSSSGSCGRTPTR